MATRHSPALAIRRLMNEVITVGDVMDAELQPKLATATVADARWAADANGFDVIAVEGNRYVQREVLDAAAVAPKPMSGRRVSPKCHRIPSVADLLSPG